METFDLSRLNAAGFERLVRALSFHFMGPGATVYSSGPDGGRDLTYDGAITGYESKKWNGYLVLQAKFRERHGQQEDDIKWLRRQIDGEFQKYQDTSKHIRTPQYYILATNIHLSGADGKISKRTSKIRMSGYSKIIEHFDPWKSELGLRDLDIWPADKLIDMLASAPDVRQTYAAWVTPGDVLTSVLNNFSAAQPDFKGVVGRALKISLLRDQFVRLKDAGSVSDTQIRTSQVFIDLPLESTNQHPKARVDIAAPQPSFGEAPALPIPYNAVAQLIHRCREKLDPETVLLEEEVQVRHEKQPARNRVVLMGGPGQGKSTASLFLTQIFRAAILEKNPTTRRDHNIKRLVPEILSRAQSEKIFRSVPHRYPVYVSLPRFADSVSRARQDGAQLPSLIAQMATDLSTSCDQDVDRADVRNWLKTYPWVLVLDGLDEVPPTGERLAILEAISNFMTEVSDINADVLIVVTTRPQGYNKDLDDKLWEHWRLADLTLERALSYARAFPD